MRIDILTLFPDTVGDVLSESILGRAQERGFISIEAHQIRDYTANKQNQVDDYPSQIVKLILKNISLRENHTGSHCQFLPCHAC